LTPCATSRVTSSRNREEDATKRRAIRFRELREDERRVNPTETPTFASVLEARLSRREALRGAAAALVLASAGWLRDPREAGARAAGIASSSEDRLIVAPGHAHEILISWGDPIFADAPEFDPAAQTADRQARQFGYDNDFIGYLPLPYGSDSSTRGLLGVNHESTWPVLMWLGWDGKTESVTPAMVDVEVAAHGFTVIEIVRRPGGGWSVVRDSTYSRRITGSTPIAVRGPAAGHPLLRTAADPTGTVVLGTLNNCAGGVTPWGTFLSGEENFQGYFRGKAEGAGDPAVQALHRRYGVGVGRPRRAAWARDHDRFDIGKEPHEANRFGWVVEIDPYDPTSMPVKHTALGRNAHEGATVILSRGGRPVVYMGDDAPMEYIYKFVAARRFDPSDRAASLSLLDSGILYAARFRDDGSGEWLPLVWGQGPLTEANGFRSQAEVVVNARRAGDLLGATRMDRPEDVEPNPRTGKVYAVMSYNERRTGREVDRANPRAGNRWGHIIELVEDSGDHAATRFRWSVFILAGDPRNPDHQASYQGRTDVSPFAAPDNLAFDDQGRMWVATDGMDGALGSNDGVFIVDLEGPERGRARQFLSGPAGCEVCGPAFTPDHRTFFVAIQHPGRTDRASYDEPGSRWPDFRPDTPPRPAVVVVYREDGREVGT
jgi:hypothetical protein